MGIDGLNKAARAAGFAMAAPDEDYLQEPTTRHRRKGADVGMAPASTAVSTVVVSAAPKSQLASLAAWMRNLVPSFGGRAPA